MRNVLARIPKADKAMVAAAVRISFAQPRREAAGQQLTYEAETLAPHWPRAAQTLLVAEADVLAFMAFLNSHWSRICSTNLLERLKKEVKRRTNVVEIFPDTAAVTRLVGALLAEADDEWQVHRRYFSQDSMRQLYEPDFSDIAEPTPLRLTPVR